MGQVWILRRLLLLLGRGLRTAFVGGRLGSSGSFFPLFQLLLCLSLTHHADAPHVLEVALLAAQARDGGRIVVAAQVATIVAIVLVKRRLLFRHRCCVVVETGHDIVKRIIIWLRLVELLWRTEIEQIALILLSLRLWLLLILGSPARKVEQISLHLLWLLGCRLGASDRRESESICCCRLLLLWLLLLGSPVESRCKRILARFHFLVLWSGWLFLRRKGLHQVFHG